METKNLKFYQILTKFYKTKKLINVLFINNMKDPNNPCLFCNIKESGLAEENDLAYASYDSYPVTDHHCLIIPKRHIKDYFDLTKEEIIACNQLIKKMKNKIESKDNSCQRIQHRNKFRKGCWSIYYALPYSFNSKTRR